MENEDKKYEIIMNNSVNILKVFSMIGVIVLFTICIINDLYDLPKIWNLGVLITIAVVFFSSIIQLMICFWRIGNVHKENIDSVCIKKSYLIFSSSITYIVFLSSFFMYSLLSIILF